MAEQLRFDNLSIDARSRRVTLDRRDLDLSRIEFDLLLDLARRPDEVRAPADLIASVWGAPWPGDEHTLEVTISRLRAKLRERADQARFIVTVRGVGYRFDGQAHRSRLLPQLLPAASSPTVDLLMDPGRIITWASEGALEVLGVRPVQLVGQSVYSLLDPASQEELEDARAAFDAGSPAEQTLRVRTPWGYRNVRAIGFPIMQDGVLAGVQAHWAPALEVENAFQLTYGPDLVLRSVTPHEPFLGWDPDAVVGRTFMLAASLGDDYDRAGLLAILREQARSGPRVSTSLTELRHADGRTVFAPVTLAMLTDRGGGFAGFIGRVVLDTSLEP